MEEDARHMNNNYHDHLLKSLQDPTEAIAYIDAALADGHIGVLGVALENIKDSLRISILDGKRNMEADDKEALEYIKNRCIAEARTAIETIEETELPTISDVHETMKCATTSIYLYDLINRVIKDSEKQ